MLTNLSIGKKIGYGFGLVILFLIGTAALSYTGIAGIVADATEVILGNKLDGRMAQNEVDHLNWANKVSALLTDASVTKLAVETDDHKCRFGQWLYGEERAAAEASVPAIAPLLKEIEKYHSDLHASAVEIGDVFRQADPLLPGTLSAREVDHLKWSDKISQLFLNNLPRLEIQTDPTQCALGKWLASDEVRKLREQDPEFARGLDATIEPHQRLHASAIEIQGVWRQCHSGLEQELMGRLDDHRKWAAVVCRAAALEDPNFEVQTDPTLCGFGKFLQSEECRRWCAEFPELNAALEACREPHERLHASAVEIKTAFADGDPAKAKQAYAEQTVPALDAIAENFYAAIAAEKQLVEAQKKAKEIYESNTLAALEETRTALHACRDHAVAALEGMNQANAIFATKTKPGLAKVQELLNQVRGEVREHIMTDETMLAAAQSTRRNVTAISAFAVAIGALLAWLITRAIVRPILRIMSSLNSGSLLVAEAASQVNASATSLASASSEQASSLEETSSALEEMSAQTRANASNSGEANGLVTQARQAAEKSDRDMHQLTEAMDAINQSSGEISKIIKVIEEIAFQTNLLALNAAVEAARAGEHGKGFAVVAEEVRNLAQRSATAARDTTALIERSVASAKEGVDVTTGFGKSLAEIVESVTKVSSLVANINEASEQQAQGVDQINSAVGQMDKVTQSIAASSEESAAAVEELSAQASSVAQTAGELAEFIGAHRDTTDRTEAAQTIQANISRRRDHLRNHN